MSRVGFQQINGHFKMLSCKFCDIYHFSFSIVGTLNWMLVHKVQNKRKRKKQLIGMKKERSSSEFRSPSHKRMAPKRDQCLNFRGE